MRRRYLTEEQYYSLVKLSSDYKSFVDEESGKQKCGGIHIYWIDKKGVVHNCYIKQHKIPEDFIPYNLFMPNDRGFNNVFYERG